MRHSSRAFHISGRATRPLLSKSSNLKSQKPQRPPDFGGLSLPRPPFVVGACCCLCNQMSLGCTATGWACRTSTSALRLMLRREQRRPSYKGHWVPPQGVDQTAEQYGRCRLLFFQRSLLEALISFPLTNYRGNESFT